MDYSVYDAARVGFTRVVGVVRPDTSEQTLAEIRLRLASAVTVRWVAQHPSTGGVTVPGVPRPKPWGTGQAVLAAEPEVAGPFAVANADDFYGPEAFRALAGFLARAAGPCGALVGYRLGETLSASGGVNRAVLSVGPGHRLTGIAEVEDLVRQRDGSIVGVREGARIALAADTLVSLNLWGFTPAVFELLREGFAAFLARGPSPDDEYRLPDALGAAVSAGRVAVTVLPAPGDWVGLTHAADLAAASAAMARRVARGDYPSPLWS